MSRRKIIIDCDPGIDDSIMLCLAAAYEEELEILAVTTVAGNHTLDRVSRNALDVVAFLRLDVPVAKGMESHLMEPVRPAKEAHGENALGNVSLPRAEERFVEEHAVIYLRDLLLSLEEGEKVTLVVTGPCTNIAMLFRLFPQVKERIEQIVLMGGGVRSGNVTAAAEFNMYEDPEAGEIVFQSGLPIVMAGLDVTWECGLTRRQIGKLCQVGGTVANFCGDMAGYAFETDFNKLRSVLPIHDAATIMYLVHPEIFKSEEVFVHVDCSQGIGRGRTVCDFRWWKFQEKPPVKVLLDVDGGKFQQLLIEAIFELDVRLGNL